MSKIAIFRHCTMMGHYLEVDKEITQALESSNLIYNADFYQHNMISDVNTYEFPTLNSLHEFAKNNPDYFILYLHTKGVSHDISKQCIADWRACMLFFNVEQWPVCTRYLKQGFDCVGVKYLPEPAPHFQGNFWWSTSNYIAKIPALKDVPLLPAKHNWTERHKAEMWLLNSEKPKVKELYHYPVNPYTECYDKENYINVKP